jgi:outer membrane protein assembly factor BamB
VYFGTEAGVLFAVNWKEAKVAWSYRPENGSQGFRSSPAVTEEIVVIGGRNRQIHGVHPKTGEVVWTFATKQRVDSSPVIVGDRAFVGSADGRLYAINVKTGKKVWEYEVAGGLNSSPAVADGRLVIASDKGTIFCFGKKE